MLVIRMQRTGRKGHAQFRVVVQDSRRTPTSGRVVANIGSYDPHAKTAVIDKEIAAKYLSNGAQPSERAARLLVAEGVVMPAWVKHSTEKQGKLRNPEKLRKNQPAQPEAPAEEVVAEAEEAATEAPAEEAPAAEAAEAEAPAEETAA